MIPATMSYTFFTIWKDYFLIVKIIARKRLRRQTMNARRRGGKCAESVTSWPSPQPLHILKYPADDRRNQIYHHPLRLLRAWSCGTILITTTTTNTITSSSRSAGKKTRRPAAWVFLEILAAELCKSVGVTPV